jgi:putative ATP-binding cassette transporter
VLTQTAGAFGHVQGSLSWFIDTYSALAAWKAVVDRLTTFSEAMLFAKQAAAHDAFDVEARDASELVLSDVEVWLPNGRPLLKHVDLSIRQGESVVLHGASGSGKTTLFRVLAGLWPYGRGHISMPANRRVLFLAQNPYVPIGTLKEALSYPHGPDAHGDADYRGVLEACGLGYLTSRLEESTNWSLVLSGGEQQRLAIGRALLYRPDWLFLDEATSALDRATEEQTLTTLMRRLPDTTFISITHRQARPLRTRMLLTIESHRVRKESVVDAEAQS